MTEIIQGDVKVPVIGKTKKVWVYGVGGLAAVYVGWRWWNASNDAQDQEIPGSDGTYTSTDLSDYGLSTTGGSYNPTGNTGSTVTDATNPNAVNDNAQWTQRAVELLGNAGYDSTVVYGALGEFLARRSLDTAEARIARAALAAAGQPPVNGPFTVIEAASSDSNTTLPAPTGLRVVKADADSITISWNKVDGAGSYRLYRGTGENVGVSNDTTGVFSGLKSDTSYPLSVVAVTTTGKKGVRSAVLNAKTKPVTLAKPSGLKASSITKSSFRVTCSAVKGAEYYRWYVNGHASGASDKPYRDFTGMKGNTSYKISVRADTSSQSPGPESSALSVKTKK